MAEEDVLFGKNRHLFGGIEPSDMKMFKALSEYLDDEEKCVVKITAKLPEDTIIDGQVICTVAGAVIRRSTTGYPKDEFDGDEIANITEDSAIIDSDVVGGETYYYSAFPYSGMGVYNRSAMNRTSCVHIEYQYLFGYDLDLNDSNADTCVTYPSDVNNFEFAPMSSNSDYSVNYGDWSISPGEKFMPRPCMLKYDGTVDHYLDPDNHKLKIDGSASSVADSSFEGNAMMEWPKIYTKRWEEGGVYHFRCSDTKIDNAWDCWCNYDVNNNEIDHFYTSMYVGNRISGNDSLLRSLSGTDYKYGVADYNNRQEAPGYYNNYDKTVNHAKANGDGWYIDTLSDRLLIQDLLVMMCKNTNITSKLFASSTLVSSTSTHIIEDSDKKGMFYKDKVFGMQGLFQFLDRYVAGWVTIDGTQYIKLTRGTHDGTTNADYNSAGAGYIKVVNALPNDSTYETYATGYVDSMKTFIGGRLPSSLKGSSAMYGSFCRIRNSETRVATVANSGSSGVFGVYFDQTGNSMSNTYDHTSGLSFKPIKA